MFKYILLGIVLLLPTASAEPHSIEQIFYPPRQAILKTCELAFKNPQAPIEPYVLHVPNTPLWFHAPLGFVFNTCRSFRNDLDRRYTWRDVATYIASRLEYPAALFIDFSKQHEFSRNPWIHDLTFKTGTFSKNAQVVRPGALGLTSVAYPGLESGVDASTWRGMDEQTLLFSNSSNATALYFESLRDAAIQSSNSDMQATLRSSSGELAPLSTSVAAGGGEIEVLRFYFVDRKTAASAAAVVINSKATRTTNTSRLSVESTLPLEKLRY